MEQLSSYAKKTSQSKIVAPSVIAELPDDKIERLRRSAVNAVRRPPMFSDASLLSSEDDAVVETAGTKSVDSDLYSTESIKASLQVDADVSKASQRNYKLNNLIPVRIISYSVFAFLFLAMSFIVLQFAGLIELRYQTEIKAQQLAALKHQQDELTVQLEQLTALNTLEAQAKALGMVFPDQPKMLDARLASNMKDIDSDSYAMSGRKSLR